MPRKAIIQVEDRNPYGEDFDQSILEDPGRDSTYIAGYSDVRRERELAVRDGKRPPPLRHRLQWARAKSLDGIRNDGKRIMHWQVDKRYKMLSYDDAIELGYRVDENPAITKGEDGLAYLGERVLMYAAGPVAAANLKKVQQEAAEQEASPRARMQTAVDQFNRETGGENAESFAFLEDREGEEIDQ